jgi:Tol biopolymer transport system component
MVSTGKGACTCAYFLPGNKEIIFSSTHGFDPGDPPQPDRSKGYTWPLHNFAIYRANADGSNLRPLYPKKVEPGVRCGYNAESTLSPDGKRIVFTSDREGDLELYTMKTDGTDVKRITQRIGYDGGAFFSPDSKRIVWRAYQPKNDAEKEEYLSLLKEGLVRPSKMEIWVANADGSDARQVTANGAANFAPFFTPDGKRIIFCSNFEDPRGRKFELYLIGIEGKETERVTYGNEFDGFPMFSPDGKRFVWASNRNGKAPRDTNIFCADWVP